MKALTIHKTDGEFKPGPSCWHPIKIQDLPVPVPSDDQVLVKILAASFNHRDVFSRQSLYPGLIFTTPDLPSIMGSDAVGICITPNHPLHNQLVFVAPAVGWLESPLGPDQGKAQPFGILGAVKQVGGRGTFAEYVCVGKDDIVKLPEHLADGGKKLIAEASAFPLGSLTAWRAVFTKARVEKGQNVLITGIGGGVAIIALQLCVAAGANVWVSSSSEEKIKKAVSLGAKGGVNYKEAQWIKTLGSQLPTSRPHLDAVIDSGGGNVANTVARIMKDGGIVSCYGSTTGQDIPIGMGFILKNLEFKGATMGSRAEFFDAIEFIRKHKIMPVVDTVLESLEKAEDGFELMKRGGQFGKIVISIERDQKRKL